MHKKCWLSTIDRLADGEPTASAALHHDHQSVDITKEVTASATLHHGLHSDVGTADAGTSTNLNHGHQSVVGTADAETEEAGDPGADLMLTTEVKWLWNKGTTTVLWLKVELKLRGEHYVSESMLYVSRELWDRVLNFMQGEIANVRRRNGDGEHVRN
uniref:Uncharacterized protein n=1 Tax=Sipha flava TaxID=143950 RepID=A0A2S2Q3B2_9HEMI